MLILRGIAFPFLDRNTPQIGLPSDFPFSPNKPFRLYPPNQNYFLELDPTALLSLGEPIAPFKLSELWSGLGEEKTGNLNDLLNLVSRSEIQNKLLLGLRWIGEATYPDSSEARFTKLSFALETMIGGDASDNPFLTTRGLTATLAERTAFLLGEDYDSRKKWDLDVKNYYRRRSAIVHGRPTNIQLEELIELGNLTRNIFWRLLDLSPEIATNNQLQEWTNRKKYT